MKRSFLTAMLTLLAACAATPEIPANVQAIRDYIEVGELEQTDRIRTHGSDAWRSATDYYALYNGRDGWYLLAFTRICREMTDYSAIKPDWRYDHNLMRRGIDTLRGCRIDSMYPLTEAQMQEIEALAKTADGGN